MPTTAELLAALPADDPNEPRAESIRPDELARMFQALGDRPVPTSAWRRVSSLSGLSSKLFLAYVAYWIRSWYKPTDAAEKDLLETNLRSALRTLETMSYLRGAVAKVGQLMASLPELVPDGFTETLESLHFQAPPMHYALIREQLLSELGDPEEIFAEFDETAIAAASIGQVHRARLKTGEVVAVKVQYPGIARSIRSDLRALKTAMRPFLFREDWKAVEAIFDEIRSGLELETDYVNEAKNLADVRQLFADNEEVVVPKVYEEYSTGRVLTMEFLEGQTLDEFLLTDPSQEQRDHYGGLISGAIFETYCERMLYNDAHPGNFIFLPDGRLGFIDFGNLRRYNDEEWQFQLDVAKVRYESPEEIRYVCQRSLMMSGEDAQKHSKALDLCVYGLELMNEPLIKEGKFDYGDPSYMRRMAAWITDMSKEKWVRQLPYNIFSHRLNFQLPTLMFQLKAQLDIPRVLVEDSGRMSAGPN